MNITIETVGLQELLDAFHGVEKGMLDFRDLGTWDAVEREFHKIQVEQFNSEGGAGKSGKWQALSSPYKEIKDKKYGQLPILQRSKRLYKSLTSRNADSVFEVSAMEIVLGTKVPYAGYHQTGTRAPGRRAGGRAKGFVGPVFNLQGPHKGGMPARQPISLTNEQEAQLLKPIQKHLKQIVANAKLRSLR